MNSRHKYFRNLRHQAKLEGKAQSWRTYWSHTLYYTKEPDTRDIRECTSGILWVANHRNISVEDAVKDHIEWDRKRGTGGSFVYYDRPEVPYTIHKVQTDPRYSRRRKDYQKYSNKLVRQAWKQRGEIYQHCEYKKLFGIAWELD
jgi:hypothetical protein